MTGIEIIALVFIGISFIKIAVLAFRPKSWYGESNPLIKIFSKPLSATAMSLVLGIIILFYLLKELSIIQIFAAMVFGWILLMFTMAPLTGRIFEWIRGIAGEPNFFRKNFFSIIIWIILMIWVLKEIFINR